MKILKKILYFDDLKIKYRYKRGVRRAVRDVRRDNKEMSSNKLKAILKR